MAKAKGENGQLYRDTVVTRGEMINKIWFLTTRNSSFIRRDRSVANICRAKLCHDGLYKVLGG